MLLNTRQSQETSIIQWENCYEIIHVLTMNRSTDRPAEHIAIYAISTIVSNEEQFPAGNGFAAH